MKDIMLIFFAVYLLLLMRVEASVDVAASLFRLRLNGVEEPKLSIVETQLPDSVIDRLKTKSLKWDELTGLLQRALLWDMGVVLENEKKAVQVFVPCGRSMSEILPQKNTFDTDSCPLTACNLKNHYFATSNCPVDYIESIAQCAVEDKVETISDNTLWSQDGENDELLDIRIFQYSNASSKGKIFTINERSSPLRTIDDCPSTAFFIMPCRQRTSAIASDWCVPIQGGLVELWLTEQASRTVGSNYTQNKWTLTNLAILFLSLFVITFLVLIGVLVYCYRARKRRSYATSTEFNAYSALGRAHSSDVGYHSGRNMRSSIGTGTGDGTAAGTPSSSQSTGLYPQRHSIQSDFGECLTGIDLINAELCNASSTLLSFCNDPDIMMKRIPFVEIKSTQVIARGITGEVWKATYENKEVVLKKLLNEKKQELKVLEQFAKEIHLAASMEHPNIVRFIGLAWRTLPDLCIVSEYMQKGDLMDYLSSRHAKKLTWKQEKLQIASDIANALVYLHSLQPAIIHRDLKSRNVLLNNQLHAKISNFGLSHERVQTNTSIATGVGTLLWTAPEILRGETYTEKIDIYSFGVVLSEMDTCLPPYALNDEIAVKKHTGKNSMSTEMLQMITKGTLTPRFSPKCPQELLFLAEKCLHIDPEKRPHAMQIVYLLRSRVLPSIDE
jgi:tRNA A-37 threonylcarbamoyl transferase component Bud32/cbb3-type cytochrome oxidase subunit 3